MIKTVDLFSGCGGLSLGFERAGFQVIAAYDNWEPAVKVYRDNFSHPIYIDSSVFIFQRWLLRTFRRAYIGALHHLRKAPTDSNRL